MGVPLSASLDCEYYLSFVFMSVVTNAKANDMSVVTNAIYTTNIWSRAAPKQPGINQKPVLSIKKTLEYAKLKAKQKVKTSPHHHIGSNLPLQM